MPGKDIPEIQWGTFHDRQGNAHVAPTIDKFLMAGHKLKETCFCGPTVEFHKKITIVIHHVIH